MISTCLPSRGGRGGIGTLWTNLGCGGMSWDCWDWWEHSPWGPLSPGVAPAPAYIAYIYCILLLDIMLLSASNTTIGCISWQRTVLFRRLICKYRARIFKRLWSRGIDSKEWIPPILCSLAGRYDNPIPTRFLVHINCLKISALHTIQKRFVRKGIWTPALIRGPEYPSELPIREQGTCLESGALDHSAILTCNNVSKKTNLNNKICCSGLVLIKYTNIFPVYYI